MFSRLVAFLPVAALVAVAAAAGDPNCGDGTVSYCCNKEFKDTTPFMKAPGGGLRVVPGPNVPAGLKCEVFPATNQGIVCATQMACCTKPESKQADTTDIKCTPLKDDKTIEA